MKLSDQQLKQIIDQHRKFTVLGLSPDTTKPSYKVPYYMKTQGWDPVGVYPKPTSVEGFQMYQKLADVPAPYRKFVDVFRRSETIPEVVEEVLKVGGVEVLWLQMGITHLEAERKAEAAGLTVISDRCLHIEHARLFK
ncbi:MAG: CoA-binding protein [Bdellovibrionales bacterium]